MVSESTIKEMKSIALKLRYDVLEMIGTNNPGHLGGSFSLAETIAVLYFYRMKFSKEKLVIYEVFRDKGKAIKYPSCEVVSVTTNEVPSSGGEPVMSITFLQHGGTQDYLPSTVNWPLTPSP